MSTKLLIVSNLFPNPAEPGRAHFNRQQFVGLRKLCPLKIIAPVPWLKYPRRRVPEKTVYEGIEVYHPRYVVIPKVLRCAHGFFLRRALKKRVDDIRRRFAFDAIFASWAYPDAYACGLIARELKVPLIIKIHGSDINTGLRSKLRQKMIRDTCWRAARIIAVSGALREKLIGIGVNPEKITVLPNGVDTYRFRIEDKHVCRARLGASNNSKHILFVGNLVPVKGVRFLIEAMLSLPNNVCLNIIGDGPLKEKLMQLARNLNVLKRVRFLGRRPYEEICNWMNAADIFCLPSLNEGCPNVILEAYACGIPVVASKVGGVPELLTSSLQGRLVPPGDTHALSKTLKDALWSQWDRQAIRNTVAGRSWGDNVATLYTLIERCIPK